MIRNILLKLLLLFYLINKKILLIISWQWFNIYQNLYNIKNANFEDNNKVFSNWNYYIRNDSNLFMFSYSREFWYRINLYVFLGVEVSRTVRNESADFRFVRKYVSIISNISKIVKNKKIALWFQGPKL